MSKRFWAAWVIAVILAVVLPVAVPYAAWPANDAPCARYAIGALRSGEYVRLPRTPLSVNVLECTEPPIGPAFRAEVTVHGAYGIPTESYTVESGAISSTGQYSSGLADFALVGGAALVSMPFVLALVHVRLRTRLLPAA